MGLSDHRLVVYWPFGILEESHLVKDPGGILVSGMERDLSTLLLVGKSNVTGDRLSSNIYQTGNVRPWSIIGNLKELFVGTRVLSETPFQVCIIYDTDALSPLLVFLLRILKRIRRQRPRQVTRYILKPDWDGDWKSRRSRRGLYKLYLIFCGLVFDEIAANSTCAMETLEALCFRPKVRVVPVGYSEEVVPSSTADQASRKPIVLCTARVTPIKGQDLLLKAFAEASRQRTSWSLAVVGPIEDPLFADHLKGLASDLGISNRVSFTGQLSQDDLRALLAEASIFCLLSRRESSPVARFEAMAAGIPVLTSEAGCGRDLAKMGARVVPIGDVTAAAAELSGLMQDASFRDRTAHQQREHILSWSDVVSLLVGNAET